MTNPIMKFKESLDRRHEPWDKTFAEHLNEQMTNAIKNGQLAVKPVQVLPEIKLSPMEKFIGKINNHKTTYCVAGMLVGGICTLIPYTHTFGKAIFTASSIGVFGATIHREAKQSSFGPPGEFNIKAFLKYILKAILDYLSSKK